MEESIKDFIDFLRFEKRYSAHTVLAYQTDLEEFSSFIDQAYGKMMLSEVAPVIIRSFVVTLMEQKVSSRSVNRKISTLRSFFKYLIKSKRIDINPMVQIQGPKTEKKLPVFIGKEKMATLHELNSKDDEAISRDFLIIEILYGTGIRLSELLNLKSKDVDVVGCQIKVLGKRNKERYIPITQMLANKLLAYKKLKEESGLSDTIFFLVGDNGKKLSTSFVYKTVKRYLSEVSTNEKKSPHVLRHTFATHLLENGADLNAIKELLGHANLSATQVYTHNTIEKLKNIHKKAHPRA